jgi:hypothetical protein
MRSDILNFAKAIRITLRCGKGGKHVNVDEAVGAHGESELVSRGASGS